MMKRQKWIEKMEDEAFKMKGLHDIGMSYREIGIMFRGMSKQAVHVRIKRLKIKHDLK